MCKKLQLLGDFVPKIPCRGVPLDHTGGLPSAESPDWPVFILGLSGGIPQKIQKSPKIRRNRKTRGTNSWQKFWSRFAFSVLNCTKFGELILRRISKIVATRCQILRLKCTKFDFGWGSALDPAGGAYSPRSRSWI